MEIDVIYSSMDPHQRSTRDFVVRYVRERGISARIYEHEEPVTSMKLIVDGFSICDRRRTPRETDRAPFPSAEVIAQTIEQHAWW